MYKVIKFIFVSLMLCLYSNNVAAQWLEVKNEKDERSISIKVRNGVPSSRVIVSSSLPLSYSSNMGDVTNETVGYGVVNGLNSDTVYFYLVDDYKRTLTISAEGYPPVSVPLVLGPKETYRCLVYDPNKKSEEASPEADAANWQYQMALNFDLGREGFNADQKEALEWYSKAAEQGHGLAQVALGVKYASGGDGFTKDAVKSARWFLIAAQQNYDTAQYAIASCFLQGNGIQKDLSKAYYWFSQSANKGIDEARYKMADMVLNGYGSEDELNDLLAWFGFFADENRSEAQYVYSRLLLERRPSAKNDAIAVEYLNKAIALSNADAMMLLADRCFNQELPQYNVIKGMELLRMAQAKNNSKAQERIAHYEKTLSKEEVFTYTKHFADGGNAVDMSSLADMYYYGLGTELDYESAFNYYSKSSESNIEDAFIGLGMCYYHGFGVDLDYDKAYENLTNGSASGMSRAMGGLGLCYYYGHGVEVDYDKAFEYFTKANDGSSALALSGLGLCYCYGHPIAQNATKGVELLGEGVKIDAFYAGLFLGDFYYGLDPVTNDRNIQSYYTLAATAGNPEAQNKLGLYLFGKGIKKEFHEISKKVVDTVYVMKDSEVAAKSIEWFKESNKKNYFKGGNNFAFTQILVSTLGENLAGSDEGKEVAKVLRAWAQKGNKRAMIALASYYKLDIGVTLEEAYEWSVEAIEGSTDDTVFDAMCKGLLGCLEFDEAEELAVIMETTKEQIQAQSAVTMAEAADMGCPFVFGRLSTYEREIKLDKKSAKVWDKRGDLIPELQRGMPKIIDLMR